MSTLEQILKKALEDSLPITDGKVANYIPELANTSEEVTSAAIHTIEGELITAGKEEDLQLKVTLQSVAKLVILIGLLEEAGPHKVFSWVRVEPSGDDFASVARLDQFGPLASNPMLNAGAITLCNYIPGHIDQQLAWIERWIQLLFGQKLTMNLSVFASEKRTGDRNRSLAYLLKSNQIISQDVERVLENYFCLCSFEATVSQVAYLGYLLANGGQDFHGNQIFSENTAHQTMAIMATCGTYNESGTHFVRIGLPVKSGVSGFMVAVAPKKAGIATLSPRVNRRGNSLRGGYILETVAAQAGWHFATL